MSAAARELLKRTTVTVDPGPYVLGSWPLAMESAVHAGLIRVGGPVALVLRDRHEVTALVTEDGLPELPPSRKMERGWAVLSLSTVMEWDVVGVLATLTGALAEAGVPLGALSAFSRDHLLVQAPHLDGAVPVLQRLCAGVERDD